LDHKSYGGDDRGAKAVSYSGQPALYRDAVERATGKPVLSCWIHFMFVGQMLELELTRGRLVGVA